jgi:hypothetical protein
LVTFRFITFSYLLFWPTAPTSSPPWPASKTIILFFGLDDFSIDEEIEEGSTDDGNSAELGSFLVTVFVGLDWLLWMLIINSLGARVYVIFLISLLEIFRVTLWGVSLIVMLSISSICNFVGIVYLYFPEISKVYS